jgi:hypothetical protein
MPVGTIEVGAAPTSSRSTWPSPVFAGAEGPHRVLDALVTSGDGRCFEQAWIGGQRRCAQEDVDFGGAVRRRSWAGAGMKSGGPAVEPFGLRLPTTAPCRWWSASRTPAPGCPPRCARAWPRRRCRQPMTDWHLHQLYDFLPALGATTIFATVSRFVVDLNRPPQPRALYPGRFETGLVPLETFQGETVFQTPPGRRS